MFHLLLLIAATTLSPLHAASDRALKESLKDFKTQTGLREKYVAAIGLQLRSLEAGAEPSKLFEGNDLTSFNEAKALLDAETARLKELQQKLTPADIQEITKGNPQSIYLRTGQILLFQDFKGCSEADYKKLREAYSVQDLYRYGVPAMAFVPASEVLHDHEYKSALQKLLNNEARLQPYSTLAQTALDPNLESELRKRNLLPFAPVKEKERQAEVERFRQSLVRAGLKDSEATDYALTMAAKSPDCLAQINHNFLNYVRRDYAKEQVEAFAKRYMERLKKGQKAEDASDLTDVKDSYLRTITDPWGSRLVLTGGRVVSPGEDRKLDTPDDIRSDLL